MQAYELLKGRSDIKISMRFYGSPIAAFAGYGVNLVGGMTRESVQCAE
jgi:hypothetical protein